MAVWRREPKRRCRHFVFAFFLFAHALATSAIDEDEEPYERDWTGRNNPWLPRSEKGHEDQSSHHKPSKTKWCGPDYCFSSHGANCFDTHPYRFCMKAVYTCVKFIIQGCRDPAEFAAEQWEPCLKAEEQELLATPAGGEHAKVSLFMPTAIGVAMLAAAIWVAVPKLVRHVWQRQGDVQSAGRAPLLG
eukprot:TRINITY_DN37123_c0_g1_i1.p1 TRINITY_DN37123_c0_g1~~TRINITY_DN37123_c0_g1_i1.p1  ORF type:complete len:198 (-),score=35.21 TRINITY_DN37123_c0_g1_i1:71-637(-)